LAAADDQRLAVMLDDRDLDQLLADAEEQSRVEERTVSDEPDTDEGWRDAEQFWGGD
jgi:hypothetical protein